jgi:prephenate dehydrogenase
MTEPRNKITIIGLGLIGGSLGLALKAAGMQGVEIVGHDRERGVEKQAEKIGAIDRGEHNLPSAIEGAALVIVATPIDTVREVFQQIAPDLAEGAVVTDTASTKARVMDWAKEALPPHVSFIGGHPMAGKETHGIDHAEAGLFREKAYCICPALDATPEAIRRVTGLAGVAGAEPLYMDAAEHDQYAAAISHLPLVLAASLFTLMRSSPSWDDLGVMAASGFRDMTRLASGDPGMSHGIWRTNREAIIHWIERMIGELSRYRDMLQDAQDEALLQTFIQAQLQRDQFLAEPPRRKQAAAGEVDLNQGMLAMLVGGMMADNIRRGQKLAEMRREQAPQAATSAEQEAPKPKKMSLAEKIAEGVRKDIEKMEKKDNSSPRDG